jgi:hypothetical protein
MTDKPNIIVIANKRVERAEFIRAFRQRGMNLIVESAHKAPPSNTIPEIVQGLERAKTMLCMVHAADLGSSTSSQSSIVAVVLHGEMHITVPANLVNEVEIAFRYKWVKELQTA